MKSSSSSAGAVTANFERRLAAIEQALLPPATPVVCIARKTDSGFAVEIEGELIASRPGESAEAFCARASDARSWVVSEEAARL